ncbi:MAG: hypothetical protein AB8E87_14530 [Prochlorococcus sp.]
MAFVLLNSCSGLDLAKSMIGFGVPWAVCFRDPVPCKAASQAFLQLIKQLKANNDLVTSGAAVREALRANNETAGADLLLTVLASSAHATPYTLPLTRRRQFQLRLKATTRKQWLAAAAAVILGGVFDVVPTNPASHYLLDRRLNHQKLFREHTRQGGPSDRAKPINVYIIHKYLQDRNQVESSSQLIVDRQNLGFGQSKQSLISLHGGHEMSLMPPKIVSRRTLNLILKKTNLTNVKKIGIDLILDLPAPYTNELARTIKQQRQHRNIFAGYLASNVEDHRAGTSSKPLAILKDAGLKAYNLSTGTTTSESKLKMKPLRLVEAITSGNFSAQLSDQPKSEMPADAVLDWSLDWGKMIKRVELEDLPKLKREVLLVGSNGRFDSENPDLYKTPDAMDSHLSEIWKGSRNKVPGVIVQAVLTQSLNLKHWLTPMSLAIAIWLTAALAVALSALVDKRWERLVICALIAVGAYLLCMQIAIWTTWLVPLMLPLGALFVVSGMRKD